MSRRRQDWQGAPGPRLTLKRRLAVMAASGLATLAAAFLVIAAWGLWTYLGPGPSARWGESTTVLLRPGASLPEIAGALQDQGVVGSSSVFVFAAQLTGAARSLKAGEYEIPSGTPLRRVLQMIRDGRIVRHMVTIPEGATSEQAVAILMRNPVLTGSAPTPQEGALLPETYEVVRGDDRAAVLQRMMAARDKLLAELWPKRKPGLPFQTPQEAIILASIVEKETGVPAERPRVAAVFVNRLKQGIPLASDPTIIYGISKGQPLGRGIRRSELDARTPYNTYHFAGLTPTPIANPGRASIAAVLDPPDTNELYFVADGTGGHVFASTYEEHERNVQKWRQLERAAVAAREKNAAKAAPSAQLRGGQNGAR